jgi:hypothetical protein
MAVLGLAEADWAEFTEALRHGVPELEAKMHAGLKEGGQTVAEDAAKIVEAYSQSIPSSIQLRTSGADIEVVAGDGLPIAGLLEAGNKGSGSAGSFTHPVFGHANVTVEQATHPYLRPAADEDGDKVEQAVGRAVDEVITAVTEL